MKAPLAPDFEIFYFKVRSVLGHGLHDVLLAHHPVAAA